MDRAAVFVDAGYVFAEGSKLIAGQKLPRAQLLLEYDALLLLLHDTRRELSEAEVRTFLGKRDP